MRFFSKKPQQLRLCIFGLDGAGKSSCLSAMFSEDGGSYEDIRPTVGAAEHIDASVSIPSTRKTINLRLTDVGGCLQYRNLWKDMVTGCEGVIFVISTFQRARLDEAISELTALISVLHTHESASIRTAKGGGRSGPVERGAPVLVLVNSVAGSRGVNGLTPEEINDALVRAGVVSTTANRQLLQTPSPGMQAFRDEQLAQPRTMTCPNRRRRIILCHVSAVVVCAGRGRHVQSCQRAFCALQVPGCPFACQHTCLCVCIFQGPEFAWMR